MTHCHSCGGVIGRDCWNPQECAEITEHIAMEASSQTAPSQNPEAAGLEVVAWTRRVRETPSEAVGVWLHPTTAPEVSTEHMEAMELVTAASAQAAIDALRAELAETEAERSQIAGESFWWKAVIGDGEYKPSGEVPSIKHLHPAMVKPVYDAHKGTAVADVIAGLIFSRAITENREQFLVGHANDRADAEKARADRLAQQVLDLGGAPVS